MRLMFIVPQMAYGGAERVISILANEWVKMRHSVLIFITSEKTVNSVYRLDDRVEIKYYSNFYKQYTPLKLIRCLRYVNDQFKPDFVINFMNDLCAYSCVALFGKNTNIVYSERNDPNNNYKTLKEKAFHVIVNIFANYYVFQTNGAKKLNSKRIQKKSLVIINPLNVENFPKRDDKNIHRTIVSVGRLEEQKNHRLLIDAFSNISKKYPDYKLVIYGEGNLRDNLKKQIQKLNLEKSVYLPGAVTDIHEKIKNARLFVLTSNYEGIPNALIEAMALGIPCISTDCSPGGARMLIKNGVNGVIVPCENKRILVKYMEELLDNNERSYLLGKNAMKIKDVTNCEYIAKKWIIGLEKWIKK